jgi:single-strand DNA-binding protein
MASLNKVLLIGNLTRDPDVKMLSSGRPVCNFGLALNRSYKDGEGNRKEEVTFVDVECYGPRAEAVGRFFTKGRSIFVEGRLKLDQWESKEGEKRSAIRVVLDNFEFVDSKQESAGMSDRQPSANIATKSGHNHRFYGP